MDNNELRAQLLIEAADLLAENEQESLNEGAETFVPMIAAAIMITGAVITTKIADHKYRKELAKKSVIVSEKEYDDMIKYFNSFEELCKKYCKKYEDVITFYKRGLLRDYAINRKNIFKKGIPFSAEYPLVSVDLVKLSKDEGVFDNIIVSQDRTNAYVKKKVDDIAKIVDRIRTDIISKNKVMKDNFTLYLTQYNNGGLIVATFASNTTFVMDDSKYLK